MKANALCPLLSVCLTLVTVPMGCVDADEPVLDERLDEGLLCLRQSEPDVLKVRVTIDGCYSSSCSEPLTNRCSVERQGSTLVVTSVSRVKTWGGNCTLDCVTFGAACALEDIPAGEYRLVHGDFERSITIPLVNGGWVEEPSAGAACPE